MLLQVVKHVVERSIGSVRYAAVIEMRRKGSLGEYNIGDERRTHIRQSIAYVNALLAFDRT
jgi:hypothetical protein